MKSLFFVIITLIVLTACLPTSTELDSVVHLNTNTPEATATQPEPPTAVSTPSPTEPRPTATRLVLPTAVLSDEILTLPQQPPQKQPPSQAPVNPNKPPAGAVPQPQQDSFLIFDPSVQNEQSFEDQIVAGVKADLARRLGVPETAVSHLATERVEVPTSNPCGSGTVDERSMGFSISQEVQLSVAETTYRYLVNGRLATFCS